MILNDITFMEICPIAHPTKVFCSRDTGSIHLNANYSYLREMFLKDGLMTIEQANETDAYENLWVENNMGSIIIHETLHLVIGKVFDWFAAAKFDMIDINYDISNYDGCV